AFLGFAGAAFAHGIVTDICIDGHFYDLYDPAKTPNIHPKPDIPGWTVPGPAPVTDIESAAIACNDGSQNGTIYATAYAGAEVTFFWTKWPASHQGPVMTYLASASSDSPTELDFFKIDHSGLYPDGTWATDKLISNNNSYTVHIPKDLLAGHYVLRHEILALQDANVTSGAQFYPVCINLEISGYGAAVPTNTVKFPGAYKPDDSDILIDIYHPHPITSYKIPGPAPY
ncbi:glycoside hydrolase, partial [Wilcoxina mikolae CBS 423.85]